MPQEAIILTGKGRDHHEKVVATTNAPGAIGPYSQAIIAGDNMYISGQLPIDPATGELAEACIKCQTKQSLKTSRQSWSPKDFR